MVRAAGSYPAGRWFESDRRYQLTICRWHLYIDGPMVKRLRHHPFTVVSWVRIPLGSPKRKSRQKPAFLFCRSMRNGRTQGFDRLASDGKPLANCVCLPLIKGQKPVGVTKQVKGEPVSIRRRIRLYRLLKKVIFANIESLT